MMVVAIIIQTACSMAETADSAGGVRWKAITSTKWRPELAELCVCVTRRKRVLRGSNSQTYPSRVAGCLLSRQSDAMYQFLPSNDV